MEKNLIDYFKARLLRFVVAMLCVFTSIGIASAQEPGTVSGTVTSASDGEPLIGASVLVKGTTIGTDTDIDGKFTVKAKKGDVLQFRYVGYEPLKLRSATATSST